MKTSWFKRSTIGLLALLFVLGTAMPAFGAGGARVWVEYRPGAKASVRAELQRASAQFHHQFDKLDAFVVSVPENALNGLRHNPNIVSIEVDPVRELVENKPSARASAEPEALLLEQVVPYGVDMVQARDIWDANRDGKVDRKAPTGAGRTVCIIDTGLYEEHEDLQGVDVVGGYSQTNTDPAEWTYDGYGHGTHVAGTIVAMNNEYGVVGVTPGTVSLFIVKIFDDAGLWVSKAHASDLVEAAFLCADNGANVISMSLSGTQKSGYEEKAFQSLYDAGILSVAAASNDGIDEYHYPASYDSVISVAAIDQYGVVADFSQHNDQVELAAPGVGVLSTLSYVPDSWLFVGDQAYAGQPMEFSPYGTVTGLLANGGRCLPTDTPVDWTGQVVLCERGDVSFADKVTTVMNGGGLAVVVYNNVPGPFSGTLGAEGDWIVAISISQEDGLAALAYGGQEVTVQSAPPIEGSSYEAWDGTSMATPHVSAVAALIWSWDTTLTNVEIREALTITAMDLGEDGRDNYYGFGLVQAYDAWEYLSGGKPGKK
ncbi:MAG: peptidase S8 [Chloroflexi bacterium]|nr:MAG: peptidase S8 [Chloroflexota bacterium]